mmetsp:Transcript_23062/g.41655  ORF Transcript_23062/g.41655 Transcript_23062/m.41655 type:complete len:351 (-) Transcript_23062:209-1261(-)|eukprot:CAMPEP_0197629198 /NCGR_PEP_ID=MMETSP1338-20131121/7157_1 /TAXON_ID=43686 ORGANISM="Pelagodinium beii, Strain RCC1491" /NCGR_SAMPLE_ID=MMETSP1338 /ASSEMBLY_ACC=CAM_ASM_000754 /LENGTH=350 /DNA_ID=CAMNT_0043200221 /DNA_START=57 /DNA_END=1109 /DNA_ORIENTATION=+
MVTAAKLLLLTVAAVADTSRSFQRSVSTQEETARQSRGGKLEKKAGIDWDAQNKLPPWMTSISEGADQAIAVVLGQSLNPDGSAPQVLLDRVEKAKELLEQGTVMKILVSGSDPAGVGRTEASMMAKLLITSGVPASSILQESQATTTAENAWFMLRWIPRGTGKVYIVTSDFHMARATYIFQEVFNCFYTMLEEQYQNDPRWISPTKKYPRLAIIQATTASFCGGDARRSTDDDPAADINTKSLSKRAKDELRFLGSGEVSTSMFGDPLSNILYIWPIQINVTKDPENAGNLQRAMAQAMNVAQKLCRCVAPPESSEPQFTYPLALPVATTLPAGLHLDDWKQVCPASH